MAHSHYVMDTYYADDSAREGYRREVMRIVADDDEGAITEAKRLDGWKQSSFFEIRAIKNSARSGDKVIFSTRVEDSAAEDAKQ